MIKKIIMIIGVISLCASALALPVGAAGNCSNSDAFLGFPFWYRGLANESTTKCELKSPNDLNSSGKNDGIQNYIMIIASNILSMASMAVGYISVAFVVYGGFQYITSAGSADAVKKAKSTITNAIIGIVIAVLAGAIFNFLNNQLVLGIK
jgi:hypothetical protein